MKSLTIKEGQKESEHYTLAHWKLGTVFIPAVSDEKIYFVEVRGSHDGVQYGTINGGTIFNTTGHYSVRSFDPEVFAGIQFIKFEMQEPAPKDLEFFIHVEDS